MKTAGKFSAFFIQNIHFFILGGAFLLSSFALAVVLNFDMSRLELFGPTAKIYFAGIKNGLILSVIISLIAFGSFLFFQKKLRQILENLKRFFESLSNAKQNTLILLICLLFVFLSHGGNILNGYFNMDDFEIVGLNHSLPFSESILLPHGNDHVLLLFIAEMKALDLLFGLNPLPYNIFFFVLFALIPFFTYLTFKRLGFELSSFFIFLIIFAGASGWTEIFTGFYIMTVYPQVLLFFSIATWSYLAWLDSREKKYMTIFATALMCSLLVDTSGIWTIPTIIIFMIAVKSFKDGNPRTHNIHE
ncbi:MAG: hypothetical protein Q8P86_01610 [bacterium]|nr:hypothetical protein [bacterium]